MNNFKINKSLIPCLSLAAIIIAGASFSSISSASDISYTLRNATEDKAVTENYLELGFELAIGRAPSLTYDADAFSSNVIFINGSYNWNGLFIEAYDDSGSPLLLGYNAYESKNWSLDFLVGPQFGYLTLIDDDKFDELDDRNINAMFGGRLTGYMGDNVVQFTLKHDISGHSQGTLASALIGRNWQVRNWNFHGLAGIQFYDSRYNDYYWGVNEAEASRTQFTEYSPGSNFDLTAEVGVTYPISESLVFRSTARFSTVSDAIMDSPLLESTRSTVMFLSTSISYVF